MAEATEGPAVREHAGDKTEYQARDGSTRYATFTADRLDGHVAFATDDETGADLRIQWLGRPAAIFIELVVPEPEDEPDPEDDNDDV